MWEMAIASNQGFLDRIQVIDARTIANTLEASIGKKMNVKIMNSF